MKTKGVNKVTVRGRVYYYDRRTGERLPDDETRAPEAHVGSRPQRRCEAEQVRQGTIGDLIARYRASPHFHELARRSRADLREAPRPPGGGLWRHLR